MSYLNDIALIRLNQQVEKSIKKNWICLFDKQYTDVINSSVYAIGFGVTNLLNAQLSNFLQQVYLYIYVFSTCDISTLGIKTDPNSQICAGNLGNSKDTCQGDSGSPLMYNHKGIWYIVGIVSYGSGCAISNLAGNNSRSKF